MDYGCPIWYPNACETKIKKLQTIQNAALKVVTGCHQMASQNHVHAECQMLTVDQHLQLLCTQFLASALRPGHINNNSVRAPSGPRRIALKSKHRLNELFMDAVHPHLSNGILEPNEYKRVLSTLHTSAVQASIALQGVNPLLGTPLQTSATKSSVSPALHAHASPS